jgi:RNA recognition motif-containing protein
VNEVRLFCGNLNFETTEEDLIAFASEAGLRSNEAKIILNFETKKPRGIGFLTVVDVDEDMAIRLLNGRELQGREIHVSLARPDPWERKRFKKEKFEKEEGFKNEG